MISHDKISLGEPLEWPYRLLYIFIPLNLLWDFLSIYSPERSSTFSIIRGLVLIIIILLFINKLDFSKVTKSVIMFAVYVVLLLPFSSDFSYSISASAKILISLMMLPIGYSYVRSDATLDNLNDSLFYCYAICVFGFFFYNLFEVGGFAYTQAVSFHAGALKDSWNTLTYLLLLAPAYFQYRTYFSNKIIYPVMFIALLIILLLSFKRIAIAGLIFGYLIFIYNYGNWASSIKRLLLVFVALACLSPFLLEPFFMKYEAREYALNIEYMKEKEARSRETPYIWGDAFSFEKPLKSLFGGEAFNSAGLYADGIFGNRVIHVDYNLILFSTGIIGLLLYLNIYYQLYRCFRNIKQFMIANNGRLYMALFLSLLLTSLLTSVAGQMEAITFRSTIFLYLGAILGLYDAKFKESESKNTTS